VRQVGLDYMDADELRLGVTLNGAPLSRSEQRPGPVQDRPISSLLPIHTV